MGGGARGQDSEGAKARPAIFFGAKISKKGTASGLHEAIQRQAGRYKCYTGNQATTTLIWLLEYAVAIMPY